ncbi:hypothetical protein [Alienimonas californiensis]|uniref:Zinc-finger domain-containing protein n=1 Tax=Alienimonas californiensis TaxID=2527989 RepID=A0A517PC31_9PLAN|nr:hypothetical protein [Alienimonas californiensis]QDT16937.1 hypothetical protein CA12_30470 [Alienimonas californiensis]
MTVPPPPPSRPPAQSLLTNESRRALALLAGDDLDAAAATQARSLAEECPDCRGHYESVREGLDALRRCTPVEQGGGLWAAVRDGLTVAEPAAPPSATRAWIPAFAVTAATLLIGLFAYGPNPGEVLPGWFEPPGVVRPVGEVGPAERERLQPRRQAYDRYQSDPFGGYQSAPFRSHRGGDTLYDPRFPNRP